MPELKLAITPKQPSRLIEILHSETLAIFNPALGDHVIRDDTHVFERTSMFWIPASWSDRSNADLERLVDQPLQAIYAKNRSDGFRAGQESGDYNYQALLQASGRVLDQSEMATRPWQKVFRLYLVSEDGNCRFVSQDEMDAEIAKA